VAAVQPTQRNHLAPADCAPLQRDARLGTHGIEHVVGAARLDVAAAHHTQRSRSVHLEHGMARRGDDHFLQGMNFNPKAPPMTKAEFDGPPDLLRALRRLPRRAAQGRHRQAADARHHLAKGTDYLKVFIAYGSPAACPTGAPRRADEKKWT
jgi:hypothetical protein